MTMPYPNVQTVGSLPICENLEYDLKIANYLYEMLEPVGFTIYDISRDDLIKFGKRFGQKLVSFNKISENKLIDVEYIDTATGKTLAAQYHMLSDSAQDIAFTGISGKEAPLL